MVMITKRGKLEASDFYDEIEHAAERAMPLFKLYGWTYSNRDITLDDVVSTITRLVEEVLDRVSRGDFENSIYLASGRFRVVYTEYENDYPELDIMLELA